MKHFTLRVSPATVHWGYFSKKSRLADPPFRRPRHHRDTDPSRQ